MVMARKFDGDDEGWYRPEDPYAELFADCVTVEDVLELQRDIEAAERS